MHIKGITVKLYEKTITGKDDFNADIIGYGEPVYIHNVLIAPSTAKEIADTTKLFGKYAEYTLGIPKGDQHDWEKAKVEFFNKTWETLGPPVEGIENMIPLDWNKRVMVCKYE